MSGNNLNVESVVNSNTAFALSLYQNLKVAEGNLLFSPYSISTALAMTYAGSRGNTEQQMAKTLCFTLGHEQLHEAFSALEAQVNSLQDRGHVSLHAANSLWPQKDYPFLTAFMALLETYYGVLVTSLDFQQTNIAQEKINAWVEEKTEEKIKELIGPGDIDASTTLVLTNAIYFKGDWLRKFEAGRTKKQPFWRTEAERVFVPMMVQEQEFGYFETEELQVLELPYAGSELSFLIFLPKSKDGLAEIEEKLSDPALLRKWTGNLRKAKVQVFLPKFTMESRFELSEILKSMGMVDAFGNADFSGMDGTTMLFISAVIHKAFIDVNEEGSEAAAATAVVMAKGWSPPEVFCADHPFLFLIRENQTGSLLFLGRMVDPVPV